MSKFKEMLAAAKLPERTVWICLRGDLVAEFEGLERHLGEVLRVPSNSAEGDGAGPIAERMEQLRAEMREHTYPFRLRAMKRPRWHQFCNEHPPRKDDESGEILPTDRVRLVNVETFFPALVRESVIDPTLDDSEWTTLLDDALTDHQFGELAQAAWDLNREGVDIPFSPAAFRMTRDTGAE
ncbi:hypothetical protein ACGFIY_21390 [Micromonospora chersina]|uniref:hypothetical protein n=1 Tax=Micromonospora chersina TaxID=47854 RepID=UPI00372145EE